MRGDGVGVGVGSILGSLPMGLNSLQFSEKIIQ